MQYLQVIQSRLNGKTDFYRGWEEYENGFGDLKAEHWLGNLRFVHTFTFLENYSMSYIFKGLPNSY